MKHTYTQIQATFRYSTLFFPHKYVTCIHRENKKLHRE